MPESKEEQTLQLREDKLDTLQGKEQKEGPVRLQRWKHRGEGCEKQLGVGQRTK